MLSGEFERKLRRLNRKLRVFCGDNDSRPAGVFLLKSNGEYEDICGVDKNYVPEHSEFNENGTHRKGGWRRVLRLLLKRGLITRSHAERVFGTTLAYVPKISRGKVLSLQDHTRRLQERFI